MLVITDLNTFLKGSCGTPMVVTDGENIISGILYQRDERFEVRGDLGYCVFQVKEVVSLDGNVINL